MTSQLFDGKSILITGGTGSFGTAFVRALVENHTPRRIIVYSRDELKQYEMRQSLDGPQMRYFIGDVRDPARLKQVMEGVDLVVHAAALKHVPIAEENPTECINTNIHGAENVIRAALEAEVARVVALSTDKAASPVNLYGATKLASDKLFVAANNLVGRRRTRFAVVRYGNVCGSRGSVVPHFRKLVEQGARSLPITDKRMTRFWIMLSQGVSFVMRAFERMQGGEIFIPKIPSLRVVDLAEAIGPGLQHEIVGIRPGEKLHEVLCTADNSLRTVEFEDHYVITPGAMDRKIDYTQNAVGETGRAVAAGFTYRSNSNPDFLSVEQIGRLLDA